MSRIAAYEEAISNLSTMAVLMGRWCTPDQLAILEKILCRLAEGDKGSNGTVLWLRLGWYPILSLMYSAGIAAVSAEKYTTLARILTTPVLADSHDGSDVTPLLRPVIGKLTDIVDASNGYRAMNATTCPEVSTCARGNSRCSKISSSSAARTTRTSIDSRYFWR